MVEWGGARGRAQTWPPGGAARPRPLRWPTRLSKFAGSTTAQLQAWALAEVGPGRLLPWLAVAFGTGIAVYFAADREPAWWAAAALTIACATATVLARRRPIGFPVALGVAVIAAGFTTATLKQIHVDSSGPAFSGRRRRHRLCRNTRGARAHGPHRDRRPSHGRATAGAEAGPRAAVRAQGHSAAGRRLRRAQGAAHAAAAASAAGRIRFRARPLFPAHRRLRLRARANQDRRAARAGAARPSICRVGAGTARRHRRTHPRRRARRRRRDRVRADHRQARRHLGIR